MAESDDFRAEHAAVAAQIDADVGVEHIAEVYARALLGAAEKAGQTQAVLEEFDELVSGVLERFPKLEAILTSGLVSHQEKAGILDRVCGPRNSPLLVDFLKVVSRHGRLDCLWAIHRQARLLYDELRGRIRVQLATATPPDDALKNRIAQNLCALLGGEPVVEWVTQAELIGGMVVRVGDTVYDGSVARQLDLVHQQMIQRSVDEIQSRGDRFRYPAGN